MLVDEDPIQPLFSPRVLTDLYSSSLGANALQLLPGTCFLVTREPQIL